MDIPYHTLPDPFFICFKTHLYVYVLFLVRAASASLPRIRLVAPLMAVDLHVRRRSKTDLPDSTRVCLHQITVSLSYAQKTLIIRNVIFTVTDTLVAAWAMVHHLISLSCFILAILLRIFPPFTYILQIKMYRFSLIQTYLQTTKQWY